MVTDLSVVRALRVKLHSNWPGAKVVCFAGHNNFGGTLTQPKLDAFEMRQQSGEYFAPNSMLSFFGIDFFLKFREDQKNKKMFSS